MVLLFEDNFTRAVDPATGLGDTNGTGLLDPETWDDAYGPARTTSGLARCATSGGVTTAISSNSSISLLDAGTPDVEIEFSGISGSTQTFHGAIFRWVDVNNFWWWGQTVPGSQVRLVRIVGGVMTTIIAISNTGATTAVWTLKTSGSLIQVFKDGVQQGSDLLDTTHQTSTIHGLLLAGGSAPNGNATMSNWKLSEGPVPVPVVSDVGPESGETVGGETVVILGYNLTGATSVKFGATEATSFTVINDGRIQAVAPAHAAGTVNINVTTPEGTSTTSAANEYEYGTGAPFIASVTPDEGSITGGLTVTILGTRFTGATDVDFGAAPAASFTVVGDDEITAVTPAHANGTVVVSVTTPYGTS